MGFRCVYDPRQLPFAGDVTLAQYVAVPEVLADRWAAAGLLASSALPIAMDRFTMSMAWHARRDDDAALHWLMGVIEDEARAAP